MALHAPNLEDHNIPIKADYLPFLGRIRGEFQSFIIIEKNEESVKKSRKYYIPDELKLSSVQLKEQMGQRPPSPFSNSVSSRYCYAIDTTDEKVYFDLSIDEAEAIYIKNPNKSDEDIQNEITKANKTFQSQETSQETRILLPDEEESDPINPRNFFDVQAYSEVIAEIVRKSTDKYSIGIYGEWGSGKTTLMKLIEKRLNPLVIVWKDIGTDEGRDQKEDKQLKDILREKYEIEFKDRDWDWDWIEDAHFRKIGNSSSIITLGEKWSKDNFISITLLEDKKNNAESDNANDDRNKDSRSDNKQAILRINHQQSPKQLGATYEDPGDTLVVRENDILTVWFNAWRYESEQNYALIPLLKTIAYAMGEHPIYKDLKSTILKGLAIVGKDLVRHYALQSFMTERGFQQLEDNFTKKLAQSAEFDKDVIYFEGIKKIQEEMQKIILKRPGTKIVVFIDDLDRCSPNKALEVFESVKVFFDMAGFIFIMGLSQEALNTIIRAKFQNMGLSGITPEQYIRKIIQVEVQIPKWTATTIEKLIKERIVPKLGHNLGCIVNDSSELILHNVLEGDAPGVGNPREVKRFINKFVIFLEATKSITTLNDYKKYLVVQAMHKKWKTFYDNFFDEKLEYDRTPKRDSLDTKITFPERVKEWLALEDHERETYLKLIEQKRIGSFLFSNENDAKNFCKTKRSLELYPGQGSAAMSRFWKKWDKDDLRIEDYKRSQVQNLFKLDFSKQSLLFDYEPFWREVIAMKMEFTDKKLWEFLDKHQEIIFGKKTCSTEEQIKEQIKKQMETLKEYKTFIESSEVVIHAPRAKIDMDLVSRRRDSYLDLWPRFKLLMSDFQDVEMRYHGRSFIKTYENIQMIFEHLQNWYYDRSGHMLMSEDTLNSYYLLQREFHRVLRNNTRGTNNDTPLSAQELKSIRNKVTELFNDISKDMISDSLY